MLSPGNPKMRLTPHSDKRRTKKSLTFSFIAHLLRLILRPEQERVRQLSLRFISIFRLSPAHVVHERMYPLASVPVPKLPVLFG
jgi:hypothetical protein